MTYVTSSPQDFASFDPDQCPRHVTPQTLFRAVGLIGVMLAGAWILDTRPSPAPKVVAKAAAMRAVGPPPYAALLDPSYSLGPVPASLADNSPRVATFQSPIPMPPTPISETDETVRDSAAARQAAETPIAGPAAVEVAESAPLPVVPLPAPRPPTFEVPAASGPLHALGQPTTSRGRVAAVPSATAIAPDNRTFIEKLFGMPRPSGPVLAYATPEDGNGIGRTFGGSPTRSFGEATAVYDIAAHTVIMPDGERLEAHSGLGQLLDDPRYVSERMRGPTPPQVYDLSLREQLFHGVQALRLNPVGGGGVFGRTGLLAHTYMLGPNGDSNGCVSFRDYKTFLHAYLSGEIRRLVVVARQS